MVTMSNGKWLFGLISYSHHVYWEMVSESNDMVTMSKGNW